MIPLPAAAPYQPVCRSRTNTGFIFSNFIKKIN